MNDQIVSSFAESVLYVLLRNRLCVKSPVFIYLVCVYLTTLTEVETICHVDFVANFEIILF